MNVLMKGAPPTMYPWSLTTTLQVNNLHDTHQLFVGKGTQPLVWALVIGGAHYTLLRGHLQAVAVIGCAKTGCPIAGQDVEHVALFVDDSTLYDHVVEQAHCFGTLANHMAHHVGGSSSPFMASRLNGGSYSGG